VRQQVTHRVPPGHDRVVRRQPAAEHDPVAHAEPGREVREPDVLGGGLADVAGHEQPGVRQQREEVEVPVEPLLRDDPRDPGEQRDPGGNPVLPPEARVALVDPGRRDGERVREDVDVRQVRHPVQGPGFRLLVQREVVDVRRVARRGDAGVREAAVLGDARFALPHQVVVAPEHEPPEPVPGAVAADRAVQRFGVGEVLRQGAVLDHHHRDAEAFPGGDDPVGQLAGDPVDFRAQGLVLALDDFAQDPVHELAVVAADLLDALDAGERDPLR
jgi:hypothetical protein